MNQRFIMTVNSGEVVQFAIEQELDCPFCIDKHPIKMSILKQQEQAQRSVKIQTNDKSAIIASVLVVLLAGCIIFSNRI